MRTLGTSLAALALAGCIGGIGNEPFTGTGTVRGTLRGDIDPEGAWVVVRQHPTRRDLTVDKDGAYVIENVPAGPVEVLATTGEGRSAQAELTVVGGTVHRLDLVAEDGAVLTGQVTFGSTPPRVQPQVALSGVPGVPEWEGSGRFRFAGLPGGCYQLRARVAGYLEATTGVCLERGGLTSASLHLIPEAAAGEGGDCAPCVTGSDCAAGLTCIAHDRHDRTELVCARACVESIDCPSGYECDSLEGSSARACQPSVASCAALGAQGAACVIDANCSLDGLGDGRDGVCQASTCRIPCSEDAECTGGVCGADGFCQ